MSDFPWSVEDKINASIRDLAKSHEVDALRSDVGRLEHSLREARAEADGLRAELRELHTSFANLQDAVIQLQQMALSGSEGGSQE